jgi:hypothetical protein
VQSQSDFRVYLGFLPEVEDCHRLHYLQMACEKIAKAYRLRDTRIALEEEMRSHIAFSLFIENLLESPQIKERYRSQSAKLREVRRRARAFAREIEKLAPAVDREQSPANAEYPWSDGHEVQIPCRYHYPVLILLKEPSGREFLQLIRAAIEDFNGIKST